MDGGETTRGCKSRWLLPNPREWELRSGEKGELDDFCSVGLAWPLASGVTIIAAPLRCEESGGLWLAMNDFLSQLGGSELS